MQSEQIGDLAKALSQAQGAMIGAKKDSSNPFFKSRYADLASTWEACKQALADNELSIAQVICGTHDQPLLSTVLLHSSGQWIKSQAPLFLQKNDPQGMGSSISYMRRYALAAMVGVYSEDDDGERATNGAKAPVQAKPIINHAVAPIRNEPALAESYADGPPPWDQGEDMPDFDQPPSSGRGEFMIEFGKYAGKKLRDISPPPLKAYVSYLKEEAQKSGKPLSGKAKMFVDTATEYLK